MSSSSSEIKLAEILNNISIQFNAYFSILILLFGTIGNFLNCLVLFQPSLRSNPCAFLFLTSSIANLISILSGLTTRILAGWNMDFTITNGYLCKFRVYIMFTSRTIAFWLIALATADRWCSSCSQYQLRQMSSLKNAQRGTIIIIILSSLLYCQVFYCYDANLINTPLQCYGKTVLCRFVTDIIYAFITVICPLLMMSVLGIMTIRNIRKIYSVNLVKKQVLYVNNLNRKSLVFTDTQRGKLKKLDRYLRHAIFIQIFFLTLLTLPQVIEKLYITLTANSKKSLLHITVDKFIYNLVLLLTYLASGMPFYIYTLSGGSVFRRAFVNLVQSIIEFLFCK